MSIFNFWKKQKLNKYGWRPDLPDARDIYMMSVAPEVALPPMVDLRSFCPPVYDQGNLGSCTAHSAAGACETDERILKQKDIMPARLFIYYNTRKIEGTTGSDAGGTIRDAVKSLVSYGYCDEKLYPYNISKFTSKPSSSVYTAALPHKLTNVEYRRVSQTKADIASCLVQKHPVLFGFTVYESFESDAVARTGMMPMPKPNEQALGGHAVLIVGYDDSKKCYIVRNSWGMSWGDKGYFYMPYDYAHNSNLCDDFWTIIATT